MLCLLFCLHSSLPLIELFKVLDFLPILPVLHLLSLFCQLIVLYPEEKESNILTTLAKQDLKCIFIYSLHFCHAIDISNREHHYIETLTMVSCSKQVVGSDVRLTGFSGPLLQPAFPAFSGALSPALVSKLHPLWFSPSPGILCPHL